jgi:hypothetical protein
MVADDQVQVVGDAEDGGAQGTIGMAHQRAIGFVDGVTLITRWPQACAAADRLGVEVVGVR